MTAMPSPLAFVLGLWLGGVLGMSALGLWLRRRS